MIDYLLLYKKGFSYIYSYRKKGVKMNEYNKIGLYDHNIKSYNKIKDAYKENNVAAIVHATGTGKSYNALQLAYDNKNKKTVYIVPSESIIENIYTIINNNPNLDLKRDFPNLQFRTYQSFIKMDYDAIKSLDIDIIILDEFHHIGAPIWGNKINLLINTHPNAKILGMTAYTIRDRGTIYERDMTNSETEEIFSNKIVSKYDLCDAMIDGVLPKPIYKSAYINLLNTANQLEEKIKKTNLSPADYQLYMQIINDVKKKINVGNNISTIIKNNIKPQGKYIYFCPPCSENGVNDIKTIIREAKQWFYDMGLTDDEFVLYKTTSEMGKIGQLNRKAFYHDLTLNGDNVNNKLRVMFAINQYNEGVHAPNIDGVIMGRGTSSDIVFFEQLGRALSVNDHSQELVNNYHKYSKQELIKLCKDRNIHIKSNTSKEELIAKLVSPTIIDLTNNFDFIKELENNLQDRIKSYYISPNLNKRDIKLKDSSFDIEMMNQDLYDMLNYLNNRLTMTWENYYELAKQYYIKHHDLLIPHSFKTVNGCDYDENGIKLGIWNQSQRKQFATLSFDRQKKLQDIEFIPDLAEYKWQKYYNLAQKYYEYYHNLLVPLNYKTKNGYEYNINGYKLGQWLAYLRNNNNELSKKQKELLSNIAFIDNSHDYIWYKHYELAKVYYAYYGNLYISKEFITKNGYEYNSKGAKLGAWLYCQRMDYQNISSNKQQLLTNIGFSQNKNDSEWQEYFKLAQKYYERYGNLIIPINYTTSNGYEYNDNGLNLDLWLNEQRTHFSALYENQQQLLLSIGFIYDYHEFYWLRKYELTKSYLEHHTDLAIPRNFNTFNGYEYNKNGIRLGSWLFRQKFNYATLSTEQKRLLSHLGIVWNARENKQEIKTYVNIIILIIKKI
jgi:hypothetical protein